MFTNPIVSLDDLNPVDFPLLLARAKAEPEAVRRLILGFRDQYGSIVADLRREVSTGDLDEAARLAHSLQGVAGMLGAVRLSELAERFEGLLKVGEMCAAGDAINQLELAISPFLAAASSLDRRERDATCERDLGAVSGQVLDQSCVLVVDDAPLMRELLEDVLREEYKVLMAADGESGLQLAMEKRPDLILLDVDLPDVDGHELLTRLKGLEATQSIPVIFVTGMRDVASETMGLSLGAVDYVVKPISPAILLARVKSQIQLKRSEAEARRRTAREHYIEMVTEFERAALVEETRQVQLKTKDDFLSHVSHELRAPAASILAFACLMIDGLAGEVNAQQMEYLGIVVKNVEHLRAMIEDLLEATRLGSGKMSILTDDIFVAEAVDYAVNTVSSSAAKKSVHLTAEISSHLPSCRVDATRLRQTLTILLDNAVKFTPVGGSVTVRARVFERDVSFLLLEVADTGCGIAQEKLASVFERLYQCAAPEERGRGLGLGLHIAQELVRRQGGELWVDSVAGVGSTFRFTVPLSIFPSESI